MLMEKIIPFRLKRRDGMKDYEALSRKHFDAQAAEYDARDTLYYSREGKISCRDIAAQLKNVSYEALLDVGCGTGFLIDLLTRQRKARYVGLDLSEGMLRMAEQKKIAGAEFVNSSADKLPFADESFDIVTCSQSFHHYPYPEKAMQEARRVLKKAACTSSPIPVWVASALSSTITSCFRWPRAGTAIPPTARGSPG